MSSFKQIVQTPTITAGAYSSGDAVGGLLEFEDACSIYKNSTLLSLVIIVDDAKQAADLRLYLFNQEFTPTADNAAFDPSDADLQNCIAVILVDDYFDANDNTVGVEAVEIPITLEEGETSLWGQLVAAATPTYAATDDLTVKITVAT